jgi:SAM-dependent methyltransferase
MKSYWDQRYDEEGEIWGNMPSITVSRADMVFSEHGCSRIIVPGCGYGRNTNYFQRKGYSVTGVDISESAIFLARKVNPQVSYITSSVFDADFPSNSFDGIYAFNFLHFLLHEERKNFLRQYLGYVRPTGVAFFTVFSEEEKGFGAGTEVEPHTFESKLGRPAHYFTREDLLNHFSLYSILDEGLIEEPELHGKDGHHVHYLRYVAVKV